MASCSARFRSRALPVFVVLGPVAVVALGLSLPSWAGPPAASQPTPTAAAPAAAAPAPGPLTPAQIADLSLPSVVLVRTPFGLGSGFVVGTDGLIVTNVHVIAGASEALVLLHDGREFKDVQVAGADPKHDLVLLHIGAKGLPALRLGDSTQVRPGEHVVAIGHPQGLSNTVSDGLVSAVREVDPTLTVMQISAPIAAGSSGGPILNDRGEVIAVAVWYSAKAQNLNFGMPVNYLSPLLQEPKLKPLAAFAKETTPVQPATGPNRIIPKHELKVLETCTHGDIERTAEAIATAITSGAPLYNDGNHEACYRIYEGAALQIQGKLRRCRGVKEALGAGLKRASTKETYTDKAWAMRDAFDGLIDVIQRKIGR